MSLLEQIAAAGVVGCGGAGFPTHKKLDCRVDYMIINGAECEPLLQTDKYLMRHFAREFMQAAECCRAQVGASKLLIAMKDYYEAERAAVQAAIAEQGLAAEVFPLPNFYPAGDEQMIVYETTGRVVPPAGIPLDVGVVISNVATMLAVYDAMSDRPFTHKYLTVTGEVGEPCLIHAPLGTPLVACLQRAGAQLSSRCGYIVGGPMMGRLLSAEELEQQVVTKTTSGVIVVADGAQRQIPALSQMLNRARSVCIQCHFCTDMCPRHLLGHPLEPHKIMRKMALSSNIDEQLADEDIRNAALCCECGVCETYACPMGLMPRRINSMLKGRLAAAGIRYPKDGISTEPHPFREYRKVPAPSLVSRLGLREYAEVHPDTCYELQPEQVSIPLKQHAGAPAQALVRVGEQVTVGQLIGQAPIKTLGAAVHSSMQGTVIDVTGERITIQGGRVG